MTIEEIEAYSDQRVVARRNLSAGLWAGQKIGLKGRQLADYVQDVMKAGHIRSGFDDVLSKISSDFVINGIIVRDSELRLRLIDLERASRNEFAATD